MVRDSDLPFCPHPYYKITPRIYLTPGAAIGRQYASVWIYEKAVVSFLAKSNIHGTILEVDALPTGKTTNDGRALYVAA